MVVGVVQGLMTFPVAHCSSLRSSRRLPVHTPPVAGPVMPLIVEPATLLPPKQAGGRAPKLPLVLISVTDEMYMGKVAGFMIVRVPPIA